jgi:hypothetical protein
MGRKEMAADTVQMSPMLIGTDFRVIHSVYCRGSLMWMYLEIKATTVQRTYVGNFLFKCFISLNNLPTHKQCKLVTYVHNSIANLIGYEPWYFVPEADSITVAVTFFVTLE